MSELVLRSKYTGETHTIRVITHRNGDFGVRVSVPHAAIAGLTLSADDTRKLRDFLNNRLDGQASEPMGTGPWVYLETDSKGNNWWSQFPTKERVKNFAADYFRANFGLKYQAVGLLHQQLVPVVTTTHEWKDIS
jgi:hypothetical protein